MLRKRKGKRKRKRNRKNPSQSHYLHLFPHTNGKKSCQNSPFLPYFTFCFPSNE